MVLCSVSGGGSREEAGKIEVKNDKSWEYTILGLQNAWIEEVELPDHLKMYLEYPHHTVQLYQGDDVCIDGSKRKTIVMYLCGKENRVIQFRVDLIIRYD